MRRRSLAIVGMALLLVLAAAAQGGPDKEFKKTVDLAAGGRLTLETFKGRGVACAQRFLPVLTPSLETS